MSRPPATSLVEAGDLVARGGLVLYPTDTLYGLGGPAGSPGAAAQVLELKGLDNPRPFPILVPSLGPALAVTAPRERRLLEALARVAWPGALTLVVPLTDEGRRQLAPSAPTGRAGFRMPAHPVARYLAARAGGYLIGTSANRTGGEPPSEPDGLDPALLAATVAWVAGAPPCGGRASTVLDLEAMTILRTGDLEPTRLLGILDRRVGP